MNKRDKEKLRQQIATRLMKLPSEPDDEKIEVAAQNAITGADFLIQELEDTECEGQARHQIETKKDTFGNPYKACVVCGIIEH